VIIGLDGGQNLYAYVDGRPLEYRDPSGQCPWCVPIIIGGLIGAGTEVGLQPLDHHGRWECIDWWGVAGSAAIGALAEGTFQSFRLIGRVGARETETLLPEWIFSRKAPPYTTPGTKTLEGLHINDLGRVEPWRAHYDEFGREMARTDFNAGNKAENIADIHYHVYEDGPGKIHHEVQSHIPGEYKP